MGKGTTSEALLNWGGSYCSERLSATGWSGLRGQASHGSASSFAFCAPPWPGFSQFDRRKRGLGMGCRAVRLPTRAERRDGRKETE